MNILFLANGLGERFSDSGYVKPKPLIKVGGKEMIIRVIESFDFDDTDTIYITYHRWLKNYDFESLVSRSLPQLANQIKFLCLPYDTNGAAHTLKETLEHFKITDSFLIADCDVIYQEPILFRFRNQNICCIGASYSESEAPIYSYFTTDGACVDGMYITDIREKEKISNNICCGTYFFTGNVIEDILYIITHHVPAHEELYISQIYKQLIKEGHEVTYTRVYNLACVGTPIQLQTYCSEDLSCLSEFRFCVDIDNTLVTPPLTPGDYTTVLPKQDNINYVRSLKQAGAYIILLTARRMRTHNSNVGGCIADIGKITIDTLDKFGVPYDELHFGKPYAHFYIDDLAIDADEDLQKSIGFYFNRIESRDKHEITYTDDKCIKTGDVSGEHFWYTNLPEPLRKYHPEIISSSDQQIVMRKVNDIPLSHLYTRGNMSTDIIRKVLSTLNSFHQHPYFWDADCSYIPKIEERYDNIIAINSDAKPILDECLHFFKQQTYGLEDHGIIHGDPVFSNIFCSYENELLFIDPRGKLDGKKTICGHTLYDYAKVFQSVVGYDFILLNREIDETITRPAIDRFDSLVTDEEFEHIKMITKSLLVTCIPFHNADKSSRFIDLAKTL